MRGELTLDALTRRCGCSSPSRAIFPPDGVIEDAADDAAICGLGVPDDARFVDVFVGKADVGDGSKILAWNFALIPTGRCDLPPLLRGVVFVSETMFPASAQLNQMAAAMAKDKKISFEQAFYRIWSDPDRAALVQRVKREEAEQAERCGRDIAVKLQQASHMIW